MDCIRHAVIDVGTNSVKLLVADVAGHEATPVLEESQQTRLGKDFYETHRLQAEAITRTARAVASLAGKARGLQTASIRVVATSAARDAKNAGDLTAAIQAAAGLPTEIISGEQEAEWSFQGVTTETRFAGASLLILDVGGGSTEFILGRDRRRLLARSFPLGTVRQLETFPVSNPPTATEFAACRDGLLAYLRDQVQPQLAATLASAALPGPLRLVGTGGTTSLLGRMELQLTSFDRAAIESVQLSLDRLRTLRDELWSLPLAQRQALPGLPANRADVILTGIAIYAAVMEVFAIPQLNISTRGLRFAAVLDGSVAQSPPG
jgi:exopolyphosphatase/guanosine-5'-triphosphate,3'-diphosphate pyrophosphatase